MRQYKYTRINTYIYMRESMHTPLPLLMLIHLAPTKKPLELKLLFRAPLD